jgi:hypothetical protein
VLLQREVRRVLDIVRNRVFLAKIVKSPNQPAPLRGFASENDLQVEPLFQVYALVVGVLSVVAGGQRNLIARKCVA